MKISDVFYEDCTDPDAIGIAIYIRSFIKAAERTDFTTWSRRAAPRRTQVGPNIVETQMLLPTEKKLRFIPESIRTIFAIRRQLHTISRGKDAIIFHSTTYFWPYLTITKSIPTILIIHGTNSSITSMAVGRAKAKFVQYSDSYAIRRADRVILVSKEGLAYYRGKYPNQGYKMRYFPTFVDNLVFFPSDVVKSKTQLGLDERLVLCCIGRLATQKRVDLVLRIFKEIHDRRPDSFLCIVGDGPDKSKLKGLTCHLGVQDHVRFYGNVPNEDVRIFYSAATLSFTLSYWEGTAKTILESLACGTPVIASDVADNSSIVTNDRNGYILDSSNSSYGAELALKVIDNYDYFSRNAYERGKEYFSSAVVPKIMREIELVVQNKPELP